MICIISMHLKYFRQEIGVGTYYTYEFSCVTMNVFYVYLSFYNDIFCINVKVLKKE